MSAETPTDYSVREHHALWLDHKLSLPDQDGYEGYTLDLFTTSPRTAAQQAEYDLLEDINRERAAAEQRRRDHRKTLANAEPGPHATSTRIVEQASAIKIERVDWLWNLRLARGHITILDGDPGMGKSTMSLDIAAKISQGHALPGDHAEREPANVIVMTTEDDPSTTIVPRLIAAGADLTKVWFYNANLDANGDPVPLTIPDDLRNLEELVVEHDAALVILDPLVAFFGADTNSHRDQDVRRATYPLFQLLQRTSAACIALRHLTKDASKGAMYRGGGSIGIVGAARGAFLAGYAPNADEGAQKQKVLAHIKSNLGPSQPTLAYNVDSFTFMDDGILIETSRIAWSGELDVDADAVAAEASTPKGPDAYQRREAETIIRQLLAEGPCPSTEAERELTKNNISRSTITRAKKDLDIHSQKRSDGWYWLTPEQHAGSRPSAELLAGVRERNPLTWYTGDTKLRSVEPDLPHGSCKTMNWEWTADQGWICSRCTPASPVQPLLQ